MGISRKIDRMVAHKRMKSEGYKNVNDNLRDDKGGRKRKNKKTGVKETNTFFSSNWRNFCE